jgi:pectate lyase
MAVVAVVAVVAATSLFTLLPQAQPRAYAAESSPVGWASAGGCTTNGGGSAATTTVTNSTQLDAALKVTTPSVIRVQGIISLTGMHKVTANKTVIGVGSTSGLNGGGLNVSGVRNVIIRNLRFTNSNDDAINVETSTCVWIDHNDLSAAFDGLVDIKRGSDFVTVSWNHTHNHDKTMLLGHDDGNGAQDSGHLRVTYVHNWFDGTNQRHPRVRFGNPVHVLNNYYSNIGSYGVASTMNAGVLVEGNSFENVRDPFHRGEASSPAGALAARNNLLVNSGAGQTGGTVAAIPYSYTAENASTVKATVTAGAGVGHI